MRTVRDACELKPNALEIKVIDKIEKLDELINAEGEGTEFFERTYITQGMQDLLTEGFARLSGRSSQAVFHLKQAMGGGKTHLIVGFGLLAKNPSLRKKYVSNISNIDSFDTALIAAFNGRNNPDHFFWGEIAKQLGKPELFRKFWEGGPKAPDEQDWLQLFDSNKPILILLDEMPPYFHYYNTQPVGGGTVADIVTRAFANMLTAAGRKSNVCVVVSDLSAAYETGGRLINRALQDAANELGRQEKTITPVDLTANEIYEILKKHLFISLPIESEVKEIANAYLKKIQEAIKAKIIHRGAEIIAEEIIATYPFHPRLKNLIALFKENEQFKQTRGIIELVSRLLKSVWSREKNDVYLIGPQHFDLSIQEVRDKITDISGMRDVIAKDIWDSQGSAHAQLIDLSLGKDLATQVSTLLLTASLSTAVNAVKGLTREEMIECLINPYNEPSEFITAFEELEKVAWYLHHTPEGRYYFDRQENLTKLLQNLAKDAPENQIEELIRKRLLEMFKPIRKNAYEEVLPLPKLEDVAEAVRKKRILVIQSPESRFPPDEINRFFESLSQKNNLLVLTGDRTAMANLEKSARQVYAASKANERIPKGHPQREELEHKQAMYEQDFNSTILNLFDKLLFPIQRAGSSPQLVSKPLDLSRDTSKPFDGEAQIEKTLTSPPQKLYLDIESSFDLLKEKAEDLLWLQNHDETRWSDAVALYSEQAGMPWLPLRGLDELKKIACTRGLWEDLGNGYISKKPKKKKTSAQIIPDMYRGEDGSVRIRVNPLNAGPSPRIHYAEDSDVSENSPLLRENPFITKALRVRFLVIDPTGRYETGESVEWINELKLSCKMDERQGKRFVELFVTPRGNIKFTLDGSEPREGISYTGPIEIGDGEVILRAFAEAEGLEIKEEFRFQAKGRIGIQIIEEKPARLVSKTTYKLDSRRTVFEGLTLAKEKNVKFESVLITIGQSAKSVSLVLGEIEVEPEFILFLVEKILEKFSPEEPITMTFKKAYFMSGFDLKDFCEKLSIEIKQENIEQ